MLSYSRPPVVEIITTATKRAGVRLLVRRDDLNHPTVSGNKWWKLKYNLEFARAQGKPALLTFGGAYSNHVYATAAAAREMNFRAIGVIRGEKITPLNHTLAFAVGQGMHLHYISRDEYRKKSDPEFLQTLRKTFGDFYLLPEGGTNALAVRGCAAFATEELLTTAFDHVVLPVGTGGTMAGIISGLASKNRVIGVTVLKNGEFLRNEVHKLVTAFHGRDYGNWSLLTGYHHGGYAKVTTELLDFIRTMEAAHNLPLDHVYTAKMMWALLKEIEAGAFPRGSTVLAIHTGGLQGSAGLSNHPA